MKIMPSVRTYTMHINSVHCLSVGVKFIMKNNKYIVQEAGSMKCQSCAFDEDLQRCFENRCASNRRDGKIINFKSLGIKS